MTDQANEVRQAAADAGAGVEDPVGLAADSAAIARAGKEGREAVRSALRELEQAGYLQRTKIQGERGRWSTIVDVYEVPPDQGEVTVTEDGFPGVGEPGAGSPGAGNLGAIPTVETETEDEDPAELPLGVAKPKPKVTASTEVGREVTTALWDQRKAAGQPVPAQPFVAVARIATRLLEAGHHRDDVLAAMVEAPTITTAAVELALSRRRPRARGRVDQDRDGPSGRVEGAL